MSKQTLKALALGVAAAGVCVSSASAALDTAYNNGDLILGFQATAGSDTVVEVNLGAASSYRDATSNQVIGNIGGALSSAYGGATWYENSSLVFGGASANNNTTFGAGTSSNGDFNSTIYYTVSRTAIGSVGFASSTPYNLGAGAISSAAGDIVQMGGYFSGVQSGGIATVNPTLAADGVFTWDDYNVSGSGTAFSQIPGSVEDQLGSGTWSFAGIENVVGVLDLYRLSRNNSAALGLPALTNTYEGSLVLTQNGDITFVAAVPEPTSAGLLGLAAVSLAVLRRRRRTA